jgi:hypothetical protein
MLVMVLAVSAGVAALLLIDPIKQRIYRRRNRRWHGYYKQ